MDTVRPRINAALLASNQGKSVCLLGMAHSVSLCRVRAIIGLLIVCRLGLCSYPVLDKSD